MTERAGDEPNGDVVNGASDRHPHEPDVPRALDAEGRCWVCKGIVAEEELQRVRAAARHVIAIAVEDGFIRIFCTACNWFVLHDAKAERPVTKVGP